MTKSQLDLRTDPTTVPKTQLPSSVPMFSKPGTMTSYITNDNPDTTNDPTTELKTPLLTITRPESTYRSTGRPITTSSVTTTTKSKLLNRFYFSTSLKTEKYDCDIFGYSCKWKQYIKLLEDVQEN